MFLEVNYLNTKDLLKRDELFLIQSESFPE